MQTILVVPCYNEEKRLKTEVFLDFLRQNPSFHLHFVNDASKDKTQDVLQNLKLQQPSQIHVTSLAVNGGKAEAVRQGMLKSLELARSGTSYIGFWDADLATPLEDAVTMSQILNSQSQFKGVFGSRILKMGTPVTRKKSRHYMGRFFATTVSIITNVAVYDSQCGAKLFRAEVIRDLCSQNFLSRWFFDVELIFRIKSFGDPEQILFEMPVSRWEDVDGSKLKLKDFLKTPFELFKLWKAYGRRS